MVLLDVNDSNGSVLIQNVPLFVFLTLLPGNIDLRYSLSNSKNSGYRLLSPLAARSYELAVSTEAKLKERECIELDSTNLS